MSALSFLSQESVLNPFDIVITKNKILCKRGSHSQQICEIQKDMVKPQNNTTSVFEITSR